MSAPVTAPKLGWAESLGQQIADATDEHVRMRSEGKRPFKQSRAHDYQCGLNGSRKGGGNARYVARKLDAVLGKPDEEG